MSLKFGIALLIMALFGAPVAHGGTDGAPTTVRGAPGPIAGAGLPILAVGYGAYWLVRRYRRKSS